MPPTKRLVIPGIPHHITQRGVRRQTVFFRDEDYTLFKRLLLVYTIKSGTTILAWCLMPNHIHLLAVPTHEDGLRALVAPTLRSYAHEINKRESWTGHLWQGRFASCPVDDAHAIAAARYIELNPVHAGLVKKPDDYAWSSARSHLTEKPDGLTDLDRAHTLVGDWRGLLASGLSEEQAKYYDQLSVKNVPVGDDAFLTMLRQEHGYVPPAPRGRPRKTDPPD